MEVKDIENVAPEGMLSQAAISEDTTTNNEEEELEMSIKIL